VRRLALVALVGCRSAAAPAPTPAAGPLSTAPQLLVGVVDDWTATRATLQLFRRDGASWRAETQPWPAVIGKTGAAWGAGLHGTGAPAGRSGPVKREGDGKAPAGAFVLRASYGYAAAPPAGTQLAYTPVDDAWKCVDDPGSPHYDQILDQRSVAPDWTSAEDMRRPDELYRWVVDVGHNPARTPKAGSCIFIHLWSGPDSSTVGCTAMAEPHLTRLLAALAPSAVYVLLPRAEYAALAATWSLPVVAPSGP